MESGIYLIRSTVNGKEYVGSAVNLKKRQYRHLSALKKGEHKNILLQNHFNKHGDVFEFSVLEYCEIEKLIEREQYFMDTMKPIFNIAKIAGSNLGVKHSEETRKKYRDCNLGKKLTEEHKQKISEANTGKRRSGEFKQRMVEIRTGAKLSEATKKKIGEKSKGRKHTKEALNKMSEVSSGENHPAALFKNYQVSEIKQLLNDGWSHIEIAKALDVGCGVIRHIKTEKSWSNIEPRIILNIN